MVAPCQGTPGSRPAPRAQPGDARSWFDEGARRSWRNLLRVMRRHACTFCVALQRLAVRRRDAALVEAAITLREMHQENETERARWAEPSPSRPAAAAPHSGIRLA